MKQCLRCNNQFTGALVFCDNCQSSLLNRSQLKEKLSQLDPENARGEAFVQVARQAQVARVGRDMSEGSEERREHMPQSDPASTVPVHDSVGPWEETLPDDPPPEPRKILPEAPKAKRHMPRRLGHWRKVFLALLAVALLGIMIDSILITLTFNRRAHDMSGLNQTPLLLLSSNVVNRGDSVTLHLLHCQPLSQVIMMRDVQEPLEINGSPQPIHISASGEAILQLQIDDSWKPGSHHLKAEDTKTHYVINSPLFIMGASAARAPHLQVSQTNVDMGSDIQWKNGLSSLLLSNSGGGTISWFASSDQPWLKLTPTEGTLSKPQNVFISAARTHLAPGEYQGTVTIAPGAGNPTLVHVKMSVQAVPTPNSAGLSVAPAVLSFSAMDGESDPGEQALMINNPGSRSLIWSQSKNVAVASGQDVQRDANWLSIEPTSGVVAPGAAVSVRVLVHSQPLLEGTYIRTLTLASEEKGQGSPQTVVVSLTVGRHCGVVVDTSDISFVSTVGQSTQAEQGLNMGTTAACSGAFPWQAYSLASWLKVGSDKGQLPAKAHSSVNVTVNHRRLQAGGYTALLVFATTQRTDMVLVQLTVLPASQTTLGQVGAGSGSPDVEQDVTLRVTPANLSFSATQGQSNLPGHSIVISSVENTAFSWKASFDADNVSWLTLSSMKGTVAAGQTGQIVISSSAAGLEADIYIAHISLVPLDASGKPSGKPHPLVVTLRVAPPCVFQVSPTRLSFTGSILQPNPPAQTITLKGGGSCAYPVTWTALVDSDDRSWLATSASSGAENGSGSTITISINRENMLLGNYTGHITITAFDNNNASVQGGTQTVTVTLNVFG